MVTFNEVRCDGLANLGLGFCPAISTKLTLATLWKIINDAPQISAGSLKFKEWVRDDHVSLERNADYWKGAALHGRLDLQSRARSLAARLGQLQSGEVDLVVTRSRSN